MKALGDKLKSIRENAGLSIDDVHKKTKISINTLTSIETGAVSKLPPKSFLRGFIVTYSKSIGAPLEEILREFDKEYEELFPTHIPQQVVMPEQKDDPETRQNILWFNTSGKVSLFLGVAVIVGLIGLIYFLTNKVSSYSSEQTESQNEKVEAEALAQQTESELPTTSMAETSPSPLSPVESSVAPISTSSNNSNNPTTSVAPTENKKAETPQATATETKPVQNSPAPSAPSAVSVESTKTKPEASTNEVSPSPTTPPTAVTTPAKALHKFLFKANTSNVSVKVTPEGEPPKLFTILSGKERYFETSKPVVVDVSEGGLLSIIHNGEDKGTPGIEGQPLRLVYP